MLVCPVTGQTHDHLPAVGTGGFRGAVCNRAAGSLYELNFGLLRRHLQRKEKGLAVYSGVL